MNMKLWGGGVNGREFVIDVLHGGVRSTRGHRSTVAAIKRNLLKTQGRRWWPPLHCSGGRLSAAVAGDGEIAGAGNMPRNLTCFVYVVPLGINLTLLRVVMIVWKIWFKPVTGCEAETQVLSPPLAV